MSRITTYLEEQLRKGKVIPFVGAGISARVRKAGTGEHPFPTWTDLLLKAAKRLRKDLSKETDALLVESLVNAPRPAARQYDNFLRAAQEAKEQLGDVWFDLLDETFACYPDVVDKSSLSVHRQIWQLSNNLVITTNFDRSLQWAAPQDPVVWHIVARAEQGRFLARQKVDGPTLWHLHGSVSNKDGTILTNDDFSRLYHKDADFQPARQTLETIAASNTILFFGCSLRDLHILRALKSVNSIFAQAGPKHYAVVKQEIIDASDSGPVNLIPVKDYEEDYLAVMESLLEARGTTAPARRTSPKEKARPESTPSDLTLPKETPSESSRYSLEDLYHEYVLPELKSTKRTPSTIGEVARALGRWQKWEANAATKHTLVVDGKRLVPLSEITSDRLVEFQNWLKLDGLTSARINTTISAIRRMLKTANRVKLIPDVPRFKLLVTNKSARESKHILSIDEIQKLWDATPRLTWPNRYENLEPAGWLVSDFWRSVIVFLLTYGFKTQDLVALEKGFQSLTWGNFKIARNESSLSWLTYIPQHNKRRYPRPVHVPLTKYALAALRRVRPDRTEPAQRVFCPPLSGVSFRKATRTLTELADLNLNGGELPTVLRQTCAHYLDRHYLGISHHVLGLAGTNLRSPKLLGRSGRPVSAEMAIKECFSDFDPYPCFAEIL